MEDHDIYEGSYPQTTLIFLFLVEMSLIIINVVGLYFVLDEQRIHKYLNNISIFSSYSILTHILIGFVVIILIILN